MAYSRIDDHRRMLFDGHRNTAYANAIAAAVKSGTVAMDLGAGLGLHGLLAVRAGARKAYLVEPEAVVNAAVEAARAGGLAERVVVMRNRIEDTRMPEQVDLLVSALTGNLLFSEDLLPSLYHARDRYLRAGGAMIPDRAQLWLAPWTAEALHHEHVARWQGDFFGFDYTFAARCAANTIVWPTKEELAGAAGLAEGVCVVDLDLRTTHAVDCDATAAIPVGRDGICHGLLAWIRLKVGSAWISAKPGETEIHWSPALLPLDPPVPLRRGENLVVELRRPRGGEWTWVAKTGDAMRRHSTFLSHPDALSDLARATPAWSGRLSAGGERARFALEGLAAGRSVGDVAREVASRFGVERETAQAETIRLALRYGTDP